MELHSYLRLRICLAPVAPAAGRTSAPLAPIVRRVLGKALIDRFCPFPRPLCQQQQRQGSDWATPVQLCCLAQKCAYGVVYAASLNGRPPYAVHVPAVSGSQAPQVELTLFGPGCRFYPWLLASLQEACAAGVGRQRTQWAFSEVKRLGPDGSSETLCTSGLGELAATIEPAEFALTTAGPTDSGPVEVQLLSPTRLISDGRLFRQDSPVPFDLLVARILDRFEGIYGSEACAILRSDVRATLQAQAADVAVVEHRTEWSEVPDYSARQGSEMQLGGKVGYLVYDNPAADFLAILRAGEILQVGKNPTSGCGRIAVQPCSAVSR